MTGTPILTISASDYMWGKLLDHIIGACPPPSAEVWVLVREIHDSLQDLKEGRYGSQ
jgi:hypothetical protein